MTDTTIQEAILSMEESMRTDILTQWSSWTNPEDHVWTPQELTYQIQLLRLRSTRTVALSVRVKLLRSRLLGQQQTMDARRKILMIEYLENDARIRSITSSEERMKRAQAKADATLEAEQLILRDNLNRIEGLHDALRLLTDDIDGARRDLTNLTYVWNNNRPSL